VLCGYARTGLWSASAKSTPRATRLRQEEGGEKPLPQVAAAAAARGGVSTTRSGRQSSRHPWSHCGCYPARASLCSPRDTTVWAPI